MDRQKKILYSPTPQKSAGHWRRQKREQVIQKELTARTIVRRRSNRHEDSMLRWPYRDRHLRLDDHLKRERWIPFSELQTLFPRHLDAARAVER
jgi:hypothetical protein